MHVVVSVAVLRLRNLGRLLGWCLLSIDRREVFLVLCQAVLLCSVAPHRCSFIVSCSISACLNVSVIFLLASSRWGRSELGALHSSSPFSTWKHVSVIAGAIRSALRCVHRVLILVVVGILLRSLIWWGEPASVLLLTSCDIAVIEGGCSSAVILRGCQAHDLSHSLLCSDQKLLLLPNNHPCPTDPHPSNQGFCLEAKLVHDVKSNEGSSAAKSCPAVDSDGLTSACVALGKSNKVSNYPIDWARSIRKLHFVHFYLMTTEAASIVQLVVKANDPFHVHVEELVNQIVRSRIVTHADASAIGRLLRGRKGNNLVWYNPAQISLSEHLLKLEAVEFALWVPVELHSTLHSF